MNLSTTIKGTILSILMIFCFSLSAQNGEANTEMIDKLHQEYKSNGIDAAVAMYKKMPEDSEYHGLQEPLNVLGYRLLNTENDADAAAIVFKVRSEEHPNEPSCNSCLRQPPSGHYTRLHFHLQGPTDHP